jgi:hypothetical protein
MQRSGGAGHPATADVNHPVDVEDHGRHIAETGVTGY